MTTTGDALGGQDGRILMWFQSTPVAITTATPLVQLVDFPGLEG